MKSRIEQVAQLAMKLGARRLADYGSIKSRHDFTQRQLMSGLILKTYLKTTYRGVIDWLEGHSGLRRVLGLQHKLPQYTALQKFSARKDVQAACSRPQNSPWTPQDWSRTAPAPTMSAELGGRRAGI
jgi:hypothetical protein